jgi:hypothetical protein
VSRGDELDDHDLHALWQRASALTRPLAPPANVVPIAERLAAERPDRAGEETHAEEESGQLAFDLAA